MGLVRQMAAIPTSPLAEPLPSNMATKHARAAHGGGVGGGVARVWGLVSWGHHAALGGGFEGSAGHGGGGRELSLSLKEDSLLAVSGSRKVVL
jgi:hypothetical protein